MATKIAVSIGVTEAYRNIAKRLGVSAGVSSTGTGAPIGLLMMQGLMQRSSHASTRLNIKSKKLYLLLQKKGDLQLLYFLLEKPLKDYVDAISSAEENLTSFQSIINKKHKM